MQAIRIHIGQRYGEHLKILDIRVFGIFCRSISEHGLPIYVLTLREKQRRVLQCFRQAERSYLKGESRNGNAGAFDFNVIQTRTHGTSNFDLRSLEWNARMESASFVERCSPCALRRHELAEEKRLYSLFLKTGLYG